MLRAGSSGRAPTTSCSLATVPTPACGASRRVFGIVSLAGDMVYEGMRSVSGPLLAGLGASELVVGLVTGAGEAAALVLRLAVGPWADRTGRHWNFAIIGYAMTAVSVPLLAITPFIGGAGLAVASILIIIDRTGKQSGVRRSRHYWPPPRPQSAGARASASTRCSTR